MTNENLNPPEADDIYELFFDSNIDEAYDLVLEDILDNDNSDFVTMEELPGGLDTDRKFKDIVMGLANSKSKVDHNRLLKKLGESFQDLVDKEVCAMYEPDPDYGRDDA